MSFLGHGLGTMYPIVWLIEVTSRYRSICILPQSFSVAVVLRGQLLLGLKYFAAQEMQSLRSGVKSLWLSIVIVLLLEESMFFHLLRERDRKIKPIPSDMLSFGKSLCFHLGCPLSVSILVVTDIVRMLPLRCLGKPQISKPASCFTASLLHCFMAATRRFLIAENVSLLLYISCRMQTCREVSSGQPF